MIVLHRGFGRCGYTLTYRRTFLPISHRPKGRKKCYGLRNLLCTSISHYAATPPRQYTVTQKRE